MPCISQFFGIMIAMYYNDHAPPHFHATYAGDEATFAIDTLATLQGDIPRRARALVLEWAQVHRDELLENWNLARIGLPLVDIEPLE
jgi:hypothetical protein